MDKIVYLIEKQDYSLTNNGGAVIETNCGTFLTEKEGIDFIMKKLPKGEDYKLYKSIINPKDCMEAIPEEVKLITGGA